MGWVRVDDAFYDHHKFAGVGPLGIAQWVAGLAWCNRNLADGFIPAPKARGLLDWTGIHWHAWEGQYVGGCESVDGDDISNALVGAGLWEKASGGYLIHDYHDFQPSAEEVQSRINALSSKRREAGRRGGLASSEKRRSQDGSASKPSKTEANGVANFQANPSKSGEHSPVSVHSVQKSRTIASKPSKTEANTQAKSKPQTQTHIVSSAHALAPDELDADFNECWEIYPRKQSRLSARDAYRAQRRKGRTKEDLLVATKNFAEQMVLERRDKKMIMLGQTFFGPHDRFEDYLQAEEPPSVNYDTPGDRYT